MKVDHSPFVVSPKLSASSFAMPSRPTKRSRSRSGDGHLDRPLKRISLASRNNADAFPPRPVFHTVLPLIDFPQQKPLTTSVDGYSMTPLWEARPQGDIVLQSPHEDQIDDGDVRMDCDATPRRSPSPTVSPLSSDSPPRSAPDPSITQQATSQIPKPLVNCPSMEMSEIAAPVSQSPTPPITRLSQPKRPRFTMGPRSDCEKCRAGVKGHWGHFT